MFTTHTSDPSNTCYWDDFTNNSQGTPSGLSLKTSAPTTTSFGKVYTGQSYGSSWNSFVPTRATAPQARVALRGRATQTGYYKNNIDGYVPYNPSIAIPAGGVYGYIYPVLRNVLVGESLVVDFVRASASDFYLQTRVNSSLGYDHSQFRYYFYVLPAWSVIGSNYTLTNRSDICRYIDTGTTIYLYSLNSGNNTWYLVNQYNDPSPFLPSGSMYMNQYTDSSFSATYPGSLQQVKWSITTASVTALTNNSLLPFADL